MWNKKAIKNIYATEHRYYDNWRDYIERGKNRRSARIFFKLITRNKHEVATTKRRGYKIC